MTKDDIIKKLGGLDFMSIEKIIINNYKSIKKSTLDLNQLNVIIGENGTGKTNIIDAINFFYSNLILDNDNNRDIFDKNNKFSNYIKIGIQYDVTKIKGIIRKNKEKAPFKYSEYYDKILGMCQNKKSLYVELIKIRNQPIRWNIKDRKSREIIYNLFPIYFIDARNVNLTDWSKLWGYVGDLIKLQNNENNNIREDFLQTIDNSISKLEEKFERLDRALERANLQIKKYSSKGMGTILAKTYFEGEEFKYSEKNLQYYSNGTNSFNYINLLIEIISLMRSEKLKFPIVILDEPEISLHHKYIDKLSYRIINNSKKINFIIATHSSRMIKNILKADDKNTSITSLTYRNGYTQEKQMKLFENSKQIVNITDEHANCYFSKLILLVEGESELELFNHKWIKKLYPILEELDIVKGMSNDVVFNIISPEKRNYNIPFVSLIDMDKVMKKQDKQNKFVLTKQFWNDNKKERYYYSKKRIDTFYKKNKIYNIINKCKFHYELPCYACVDKNYFDLIKCVKEYFKQYNIFVCSTTIEGMLINYNNYKIFWEFYKKKASKNIQQIEGLYQTYNIKNKLNLLRLLVEGKTDYILNLNELDKMDPSTKKEIEKGRLKKQSGWISEWIQFYYDSISINKEEKEIKFNFEKDFRELTILLENLNEIYYNK